MAREQKLNRAERYIVERIERGEEGPLYVLSPIARYPVRQIEVGDVFQPAGHRPAEVTK